MAFVYEKDRKECFFEIALDYVVRNEFEDLVLFNNNILETRQHSTENGTGYGGMKAGLGFPSASGPRKAQSAVAGVPLTTLTIPRGFSSSHSASGTEAQPARAGLHVQPTAFHLDGRSLDLQKEWKPQCDTFPFSVLKHTAVLACVFPTSQGKIK